MKLTPVTELLIGSDCNMVYWPVISGMLSYITQPAGVPSPQNIQSNNAIRANWVPDNNRPTHEPQVRCWDQGHVSPAAHRHRRTETWSHINSRPQGQCLHSVCLLGFCLRNSLQNLHNSQTLPKSCLRSVTCCSLCGRCQRPHWCCLICSQLLMYSHNTFAALVMLQSISQ